MGKTKVIPCDIKGLCVTEPAVFKDGRGYSMETYDQNGFRETGPGMVFAQDNQSMSIKGVLRRLRFQKQYPQGKLVRVVRDTVYDVVVDLHSDPETCGKRFGVILSAENKKQLYMPGGSAHGFLVLSDEVEFAYRCMDFYHPGDGGGPLWSDPETGVDWPIRPDMQLVISDKDRKWSGLRDIFKFRWKGIYLYELCAFSDERDRREMEAYMRFEQG